MVEAGETIVAPKAARGKDRELRWMESRLTGILLLMTHWFRLLIMFESWVDRKLCGSRAGGTMPFPSIVRLGRLEEILSRLRILHWLTRKSNHESECKTSYHGWMSSIFWEHQMDLELYSQFQWQGLVARCHRKSEVFYPFPCQLSKKSFRWPSCGTSTAPAISGICPLSAIKCAECVVCSCILDIFHEHGFEMRFV